MMGTKLCIFTVPVTYAEYSFYEMKESDYLQTLGGVDYYELVVYYYSDTS